MSDEYGSAFEKDFYSNAATVHVEIDILNDLWKDLLIEFAENEWSQEDGLRYVLAAGLTYLQGERLTAEDSEENVGTTRLAGMLRERIAKDGSYAVLRYRAYQFMQDARTFSMKLNACREERDGLSQEIANLRGRLKGLHHKNG